MTSALPIDLGRISDPHALLEELARRHFLSFLIRCYPHLSGGADLVPNWHLEAIACQLERVRKGECRRLLVTLPPRNLKSIMISVAWVAWRLGLDPTLNFVCVSYSNELSAKHARDCRAIMQSAWRLQKVIHRREVYVGWDVHGAEVRVHALKWPYRIATYRAKPLQSRVDGRLVPEDKPDCAVRRGNNHGETSNPAVLVLLNLDGITYREPLHEQWTGLDAIKPI